MHASEGIWGDYCHLVASCGMLLAGGGILKSCHADSYYQQPLHFTRTSLFYVFGNNNSALVQLFEHVIANVDSAFYNKKLQIIFGVQYKQGHLKKKNQLM